MRIAGKSGQTGGESNAGRQGKRRFEQSTDEEILLRTALLCAGVHHADRRGDESQQTGVGASTETELKQCAENLSKKQPAE